MTDKCPVCQAAVADNTATCPVCGFKLLGSTQEFKPVVVEEDRPSCAHNEDYTGVLKVVRGPRTGVEYALPPEGEIRIGRNPQHCTIFLNDMTVSRLHATIDRIEGRYMIHDENSYNGVWVNNKNVNTKVLEPGDYLQIGAFCFQYEERANDESPIGE